VYRGLDIGTAKPTPAERAEVPHHVLDLVDPSEDFSVTQHQAAVRDALADIAARGAHAVIVGGTGLYIKALIDPLFNAPDMDAVARSQLEAELAERSVAELRRWCEVLDPPRSHLGRTQLIRSIETALLSGARMSDLHDAHKGSSADVAVEPRYLLIDSEESLASQIERRVDRMLDDGWIDEVEHLTKTVPPDAPAWKASGYAAIRERVEGKADLSTTRQRIIIETRQYAKRQRTWFRHQLPAAAVTKLNPLDSQAIAVAREWWERSE